MGIEGAFDAYQKTVDADPDQVKLARDRRDAFKAALRDTDVDDVWGSGSLRRATQLKPVHDVDLVVEFSREAYPDWGQPGDSSEAALDLVHDRVKAALGDPGGSEEEWVRRADPRDRAVKCFLDDPDDPDGFTVDVMPALRQDDDTLLIPGKGHACWIVADPEYLIERVEKRQQAWSYYRPLVRVLKQWRRGVSADKPVKSLVIEVLALECLPAGPTRSSALSSFFTSAAFRVNEPIEDPAGHCGPIQPDLDVDALRDACEEARELAAAAMTAEDNDDFDEAKRLWRTILGADFPAPAKAKKTGATLIGSGYAVRDVPQG
ncbi:hypothetical protein [Amycolatopsis sp. TNS106]|uniref:hypothetical protein n=1 Tax=Amycolatopsis sp. TNS106 TaxID=2861750 RepID=UPI001C561B3D|nr:hypothetical protein [Amycolatopsis sp. TNS106]QXV57788.1 hypothetical protein CVV72_12815 [Amycolatopsis sp. TNS106]